MKPTYYKALWQNCHRCRIHYMSEEPHLRAFLCDECWNAIPHFVVKSPKIKKGPTYKAKDFNWKEITLYTIGNLLCLMVIGYYLYFK